MIEDTKTVFIGCGSNLGHKQRNILNAIALINTKPSTSVSRCSSMYPTSPLSDRSQPEYLNGIIEIETALNPFELLKALQDIEKELGREKDGKWMSRTIDLDIIFYGNEVVDSSELTIPHKQMHLRSFVLDGMCQLEPEMQHPVLKRTCRQLNNRLGGGNYFIDTEKPALIEMSGPIGVGKTTLAEGLTRRFKGILLKEKYDENPYLPLVYEGRDDLALKSELFFLENSLSELRKDGLSSDKVYVADYIFEKSTIYPKLWLSSEDFKIFHDRYFEASGQVATPTLIIDISDTAQNCLERIHTRSRKYEQDITTDFLCKLAGEYEDILRNWKKSPIIRLDASQYDFRNESCIDKLFDEIKYYVINQ